MNESTPEKTFKRSFKNEDALFREKLLQEQVDNLSATVNKLLEPTNIDKASTAHCSSNLRPYQSFNVNTPYREKIFFSTPRAPPQPRYDRQTMSQNTTQLCYCYSKFGERAQWCQAPCSLVNTFNAEYHGFFESARARSGSFKPYVGTVDTTGDRSFFNSVDTTGLIFVRDPETHIHFLVDTGSKLSILPCNRSDNDLSFSRWLYTANGTRTYTSV